MLDYLKRMIATTEETLTPQKASTSTSKKIQIATAALFIEIAKADGEISGDERKRIVKNMEEMFDLDDECVENLLALSEQRVNESVSVYEFSSIINENFSREEKYQLMKNLWKIVYTDNHLDQYEDRLMKIIGATLNLDHKDIIDAKLEVKENK
jgi:uncharacterized tellurite resistance protein B-like protein